MVRLCLCREKDTFETQRHLIFIGSTAAKHLSYLVPNRAHLDSGSVSPIGTEKGVGVFRIVQN